MRFSRVWIRGFFIGVVFYLIINFIVFSTTGPFFQVGPFAFSKFLSLLLRFLVHGPLAIFILMAQVVSFSPIIYQAIAISALVSTAVIYGLIGAYISTYLQKRKEASKG